MVDIVTGKAFQRQAQTPWASNEKEELMKQRQDLRRAQFQQRTQQMGLGQKQVPNLNDIFQQQKDNNKLSNNKWKKKKWNRYVNVIKEEKMKNYLMLLEKTTLN